MGLLCKSWDEFQTHLEKRTRKQTNKKKEVKTYEEHTMTAHIPMVQEILTFDVKGDFIVLYFWTDPTC